MPTMRNLLPVGLAGSIFLLMISGPFFYKHWHDHEYRNLHVVEPGVLYRSGQLPLARLQHLVMNQRIRTVVCLREGDKLDDQAEEAWIKARGLNFVRIPPRQWWPDSSGQAPADESVAEFRKVMDDPAHYPVLVHCYAGIHRTGTMCAVFRMDYQGWTNEQAMAEMRTYGYTMLDDHEDVLGYLSRYHSPRDAKAVPAGAASLKKNPLP
jgi:protein tyrosine/serine phosphatase